MILSRKHGDFERRGASGTVGKLEAAKEG